jgi:hypothetical protein
MLSNRIERLESVLSLFPLDEFYNKIPVLQLANLITLNWIKYWGLFYLQIKPSLFLKNMQKSHTQNFSFMFRNAQFLKIAQRMS